MAKPSLKEQAGVTEAVNIVFRTITSRKNPTIEELTKAGDTIKTYFGSVNKFYNYLDAKQRARLKNSKRWQERVRTAEFLSRKSREESKKALELERKLSKQWGAQLGKNLSLMFTAQRVSRTLSSALKDWFSTYQKITEGQTEFGNQMNRLMASVTFLKFSLMNAFTESEIGRKFLEFIVNLTDKVGEFISAHPNLSVGIVIGTAAISSVAALAGWASQIALLVNSLKHAKDVGNISSTFSVTEDIPDTTRKLVSGKQLAATLALTVAVSYLILKGGEEAEKYLAEGKTAKALQEVETAEDLRKLQNKIFEVNKRAVTVSEQMPVVSQIALSETKRRRMELYEGSIETLSQMFPEDFMEEVNKAKQLQETIDKIEENPLVRFFTRGKDIPLPLTFNKVLTEYYKLFYSYRDVIEIYKEISADSSKLEEWSKKVAQAERDIAAPKWWDRFGFSNRRAEAEKILALNEKLVNIQEAIKQGYTFEDIANLQDQLWTQVLDQAEQNVQKFLEQNSEMKLKITPPETPVDVNANINVTVTPTDNETAAVLNLLANETGGSFGDILNTAIIKASAGFSPDEG